MVFTAGSGRTRVGVSLVAAGALLVAVAAVLVVSSTTEAEAAACVDIDGPFSTFVVYGAGATGTTSTGNTTNVRGGLIGGGSHVSVGGSNDVPGIRSIGNATTGNTTDVGNSSIVANGSVSVGGSNEVAGSIDGASVSTGSNTDLLGYVTSGGHLGLGGGSEALDAEAQTATLGNNATITGTLILPNGVSPTLGGGASVATLINNGSVVPGSPATFGGFSLPGASAYAATADNQSVGGGGTLTLPPGDYGSLTSGNTATLNLSSGSYVFSSVTLGGSNTVNMNLSGGPITIFVVGNFTTGNSTNFVPIGGGASSIYLESAGIITFGGSNTWHGTVFSTKSSSPSQASVITGNSTTIVGALYSNQQVSVGGSNCVMLAGPFFGPASDPFECPEGLVGVDPESIADCSCPEGFEGDDPTSIEDCSEAEDVGGGDPFECPAGFFATTVPPVDMDDCEAEDVAGGDPFECPDGTTPLIENPISDEDCALPDTGPGQLLAALMGGAGMVLMGSGSLAIASDRRRRSDDDT